MIANTFAQSRGLGGTNLEYDEPGVAELYDFVPRYSGRQDVDFYVDVARETDGPVLELGAGTGRVLIPIARTGATVVGVDSSPAMLDVCKRKLAAEPADVRARAALVRADIRSFSLGERFAAIIIPFRPFQHLLTIQDQIACLECVRGHLARGGRLVFDVFHPHLGRVAETFGEERAVDEKFELPDGRMLWRTERRPAAHVLDQIIDVDLIWYVSGNGGETSRAVQSAKMRWFLRWELEHLLARCGFTVRATYGGFDRQPISEHSAGEMIFVATAQ